MAATRSKGFTLIENIIAITLAAFLMLAITALLVPTTKHTADVLTQQRASQLASWLLQQMYSREYDEVNIQHLERCGVDSLPCSFELGLDANDGHKVRDDFDDYDTAGKSVAIEEFDLPADGPFQGFLVAVRVRYANDQFEELPLGSTPTPTKLVQISIKKGEGGQPLTFNAFRSNY